MTETVEDLLNTLKYVPRHWVVSNAGSFVIASNPDNPDEWEEILSD